MSMNFCPNCGRDQEQRSLRQCFSCGHYWAAGPTLLTLVSVFARDKLLLIRRGTEPYSGKWAPPGGYLERGETLEAGAARELQEEAGIFVSPARFAVTGMVSLPRLNQVHVMLQAVLDSTPQLVPSAPEALDARWFSHDAFPVNDVWDPWIGVDVDALFRGGHSQSPKLASGANGVQGVFPVGAGRLALAV